jgi:hypothetical protein
VAEDPAILWDRYMQLTQIEAAFKCLKSDLGMEVSSILCKRFSASVVRLSSMNLPCISTCGDG